MLPKTSRWCRDEHVCMGVKFIESDLSDPTDRIILR